MDNSLTLNNKLKIIPNPNNGNFIVYLSKYFENPVKLEITNILGKLVYSKYINNSDISEINLENLSPGVYYLNESSENSIQTIKFIVLEN